MGWGALSSPALISVTNCPILRISAAFEILEKTNFDDLSLTSDVTGQVKDKMFDMSAE